MAPIPASVRTEALRAGTWADHIHCPAGSAGIASSISGSVCHNVAAHLQAHP